MIIVLVCTRMLVLTMMLVLTSGFYAGYSEANFKLNEAYGEDQTGCRVSKQNTFKKASCSNITSERRRSSVRI